MKIIKLIAVFAVVIGIAVVALLLFDNSGTKRSGKIGDTIYLQYKEEVEKSWQGVTAWDEEIFTGNATRLHQLEKEYDNIAGLLEFNATCAVTLLDSLAVREWNQPGCSRNTINEYMGALNKIVLEHPKSRDDIRVKKLQRINEAYTQALKVANAGYGLSPGFNGTTWTNDFDAYSQQKIYERNRVLNNDDYKKYLSNISSIKSGLSSVPDRLSRAKERFRNDLANQICSYYGAIAVGERTKEQFNTLNNLRNAYYSKFGNSPGRRIENLCDAYEETVYNSNL